MSKFVVESLLDTDLYKITMMQCAFHQFPEAHAEYAFKNRSSGVDLLPYKDEIIRELRHLCTLKFSDDELNYLRGVYYIKSDFVDFLEDFTLKFRYINVSEKDDELDIRVKGHIIGVMLFEIFILKIVNEVYFINTQPTPNYAGAETKLLTKIKMIKDYMGINGFVDDVYCDRLPTRVFQLMEFGTRRAFSGKHQKRMVEILFRYFT